MDFRKYMHIERFGKTEVQGIELGECYIFPKIDGTNGSVWVNKDGKLKAGSRKMELSLDSDNAGFFEAMTMDDRVSDFLLNYPHLRLYGEWLVPHALKTYREDAWRKFYIFDVYHGSLMHEVSGRYLSYDEYQPILEEFGLDYIPPLCIKKNATYENLLTEIKNNGFLIKDGEGAGEGIVIKNYNFSNKYGRIVWAKLITNAFKEKHSRQQPTEEKAKAMVEQQICDKYVTPHLVDKVYAKIVNENNGWNSKDIPRLLSTVYYDLINEEIWDAVKKLKYPTINFKTLSLLTTHKIKELKAELF